MGSMTASRFSVAARGLPGRFTMRVRPRLPGKRDGGAGSLAFLDITYVHFEHLALLLTVRIERRCQDRLYQAAP